MSQTTVVQSPVTLSFPKDQQDPYAQIVEEDSGEIVKMEEIDAETLVSMVEQQAERNKDGKLQISQDARMMQTAKLKKLKELGRKKQARLVEENRKR